MKLITYTTGIEWLRGLLHQAATDLRRAHVRLLGARMEYEEARHDAEILSREIAARGESE